MIFPTVPAFRMASDSPVRVERTESVLTLTIDRPGRLNALDVPSFRRLRLELEAAALDRSLRCVLLTGAGTAFCAGGDVAVMEEHRAQGTLDRLFHELTGERGTFRADH
ncbi:Enoyl-CoA hydratase/isomerase, partial [mine drainage metagenome]